MKLAYKEYFRLELFAIINVNTVFVIDNQGNHFGPLALDKNTAPVYVIDNQ